ncbi:histone chaperone, partial [Coemansia sp. RSA 2703]
MYLKMSENKAVDIKNDDKSATAPTPQNTPIFTAPIAAAAAANANDDDLAADALRAANPALMSMLQGRLGSLVGAPSGYIESLPKVVRDRID